LQSTERQSERSVASTARLSLPQTGNVPLHTNMPWPVKITVQNVNVYFISPPAIGVAQKDASTSNESLPQSHLVRMSDAGEKETLRELRYERQIYEHR